MFSGLKTQCQQAVEALPQPPPIGAYVPQCDKQGRYIPLQFHGSTGYSWCVDAEGKEIPGTLTPPSNPPPKCPKQGDMVARVTLNILSNKPKKEHTQR